MIMDKSKAKSAKQNEGQREEHKATDGEVLLQLLELRRRIKASKPSFRRGELYKHGKRYKKLEDKWRKPKGRHSKLRQKRRHGGAMPHPHFGAPLIVRGMHPSGLREKLVFRTADLEGIDPTTYGARISSTVGAKKRALIFQIAKERKIRVFNPQRIGRVIVKKEKGGKGVTEATEANANEKGERGAEKGDKSEKGATNVKTEVGK